LLGNHVSCTSSAAAPDCCLELGRRVAGQYRVMALADLMARMARAGSAPDAVRDRIESKFTVVMLPMLNPDGAELFQRENADGVDINRDVRRLSTPEARVLKAVRESGKSATSTTSSRSTR